MPSVRRTEDVVCTFEERFVKLIHQTLIMTPLGGQSYLGLCTDLFVWKISSILSFNSVHNLHESIWVSSLT